MRNIYFLLLSFCLTSCLSTTKNEASIIDKIYVVTLDRTPQRYEEAKQNLQLANLTFSRFSGTDGYNMKVVDKNSSEILNGKEWWNSCKKAQKLGQKLTYEVYCDNNIENNIQISACPSPGEIGCYCSMRRVWKDILKNNHKYVLILEDDTKIQKKDLKTFKSQINSLISNTPLNWDVIYLHLHNRNDKLYPARKIHDKTENEYVWGINRDPEYSLGSTIAYIVNRSFAEKMYIYSERMNFPIDMQIADAINKRVINGYKAKKQLVIVGEDSVIDNMGRNKNGILK